jgi:hypothetical protein
MSQRSLLTIGTSVALDLAVGATVAVAQFNPWNNNSVNMRSMTDNWSAPNPLGSLASNEGIYVDMKEFRIAKGAAKGDPAPKFKRRGPGGDDGDHLPSGNKFTSWTARRQVDDDMEYSGRAGLLPVPADGMKERWLQILEATARNCRRVSRGDRSLARYNMRFGIPTVYAPDASASEAAPNRIKPEYYPPKNPAHQTIYDTLREKRALEKP